MNPQQAYQLAQFLSAATGRNIRPVQQSQQRMLASPSFQGVDKDALQRALQNSNIDFAQNMGGNDGSSSELRSMIRENAKSIESIRQTLEREVGGSGARITAPNYDRGIGGGIHHSQPGSGGVNPSEIFTVPSAGGVSPGQVETLEWTGIDLDRLRNNTLCKVEAVAGPDTQNQAEFITVDMEWNGDSVPELQNIPLSYLIPTLDGDRQYFLVEKYVPTNVTPSMRVTFSEEFTPTNDEPLFFRAVSGGECA